MDGEESVTSTEYSQDTVTDLALAESIRSKKDTLADTGTTVDGENDGGDYSEMKLLKEIMMGPRDTLDVNAASALALKKMPQRLEDVLRHQLHTRPKTDRGTQTNWGWRVMAERWRHARVVPAKTRPMELSDLREHLMELKMKIIMQEDEFLKDELEGMESTDEWIKRIWKQKKMDILDSLRTVRECDKITDTADLDMNPGDSPMGRNQVKLSGRTLKGDSKTELRAARLHSMRSLGGDHHQQQQQQQHQQQQHRQSISIKRRSSVKPLSPELAMVRQQLLNSNLQQASKHADGARGSQRHSNVSGGERRSSSKRRGSMAESDGQGGSENRQSQGGSEKRQSQGAIENRQSQGGSEKRQSQGAIENRQSQGAIENRQSQGGSEKSHRAEVAQEADALGVGGGGGTASHSRRDSKVSNASKKSAGRRQSIEPPDRQSY